MSAPPDGRSQPTMSAPNHQEQPPREGQQSNVRVIPIVVEGRDEPVINKNVDHGTHFGEAKPGFAPPPQPHIDREQYFADEGPMGYAHPPNFTRSFGAPYSKFRQGPQPFVHQKVYPQSATAFGRGPSPQRSQSPAQHPDVKVPVHHEQAPPPPPPPRAQQRPAPQQPPPQQHPPQQQQRQPTPPPKPQPPSNDPITQILSIQTDVLNLMTDVENFKGTKKDKSYLYLDEMLTRNLIKLDNIETEGKENIRQARKEAIKCIQKCIAVLEAKAEGNNEASAPQSEEVEMAGASPPQEADMAEQKPNGEVEMTEAPKDEAKVEPQPEQKADEKTVPAVADTRPNETPEQSTEAKPNAEPTEQNEGDKKAAPKKGAKNTKKRDKSKENKDSASNKEEKVEAMQIDGKGDKSNTHMEVDASSQ